MDDLERAASELIAPTLDETADWLGRLEAVIRKLNSLKRSVTDELEGPVTGTVYRVAETRSAKRSYNTAGLLAGFAAQGWDLKDLLASDACRLAWRWTDLKRAAATADVTLSVASHEVEDEGDLDEAMIGEVWTSRWKVEANDA